MEENLGLELTPLCNQHKLLGAKMAPFGGWLMPIQYQGILAEHFYTRTAVSVFDICHMGEFILEADPVSSGFDQIVTQNLMTMPEKTCRYGFMLNDQAGVIDDLVVYRINKNKWMLVVNATTTSNDYAHLLKNLKGEYKLENISEKTGKLDVQGPESLAVLQKVFEANLAALKYYTFSKFTFQNQECIISRTGYTGERGYEIYISSDDVIKLWETLLKDARVKPAGLGARDTLRLEMSYPLYGQDIDINHSPLAAGLIKFVDLTKDFIGKAALLDEQKRGPKEKLICFQADTRRAPRHNFAIMDKQQSVGTVTSGSFSPSLTVGIGMGYVGGSYPLDTQLVAKELNTQIPIKIVKRPFLKTTSL